MSADAPGPQPPTLLRPSRQPLVGYLAASVLGHGSFVVLFLAVSVFGRACAPSRPVIDVDDAIEVSMVVLPKSETKMPDRAARAPVPKGAPTPEPQPDTPPPVKESDLAVKVEQPEPKPEGVSEDDRRRQLMEELERQRILDEMLNAPDGPVDRDATDPNSTSDEAIDAVGSGARGDPEYAAYIAKIQQLFKQHFRPLAAITEGKPDLVTKVFVTVDPASGAITGWEITGSSGIPAYDAAAERAVAAVQNVPLPPDPYLHLVEAGYEVKFTPP